MVLMAGEATPETRTTIDSMIELLKSRGKMELSQISETLDVGQNIVENWAKVLEKGNLVKITYEVGKMFVSPYGMSPEQEHSAKTEAQMKTGSIESTASSGILSLESLSETLQGISSSIAAAEKLESEQMPQMRAAIAQINSIYEAVDQRTRSIDQMAKRANGLYDSINKRAVELSGKISEVESTGASKSLDDARQDFAKIMSDASEIDKQIALMGKSAHDSINQLRKGIDEQVVQLRQQLDTNRKEIDAKIREHSMQLATSEQELRGRVKAAGTIIQEVNEFEREKEKISRKIRDIRAEFNDSYAKTSEEINRNKGGLDATSKSLLDQIDAIRKSFGDAASIDDTITRVKGEIAAIEADIAAQKQELSAILVQIRSGQYASDAEPDKKGATLGSIGAEAAKAASNVGNIKKRVKKASDKAKQIGKKEPDLQE